MQNAINCLDFSPSVLALCTLFRLPKKVQWKIVVFQSRCRRALMVLLQSNIAVLEILLKIFCSPSIQPVIYLMADHICISFQKYHSHHQNCKINRWKANSCFPVNLLDFLGGCNSKGDYFIVLLTRTQIEIVMPWNGKKVGGFLFFTSSRKKA